MGSTPGVGLGQRSRFLVLTKRSAASGNENVCVSSRVTNITCDGSVAKPEHAQCSHFRSMAEVSFLPSTNTRKRASASRESSPLTVAKNYSLFRGSKSNLPMMNAT